jgi:uncharacterized membrane protein
MSNSDDLEERFRQMEQEINNKFEPPLKSADPVKSEFDRVSGNSVDTAKNSANGLISRINGLTGVTKIAAIAVVGIVLFTVVKFLVSLVAAAVSLVFMFAIAYVLYKIFFQTKPSSKL